MAVKEEKRGERMRDFQEIEKAPIIQIRKR